MAGLAKEFEQLGCWESATEEENIVIYLDNGKELSLAQKRSSDFREEMNKFLQKTQRRE